MENLERAVGELSDDTLQNVCVQNNSVSGEIKLSDDKILFLSIPSSSGWTAYVDGEQVKIYNANYAFMALPLEKGEHEIVLKYETPLLKMGLYLLQEEIQEALEAKPEWKEDAVEYLTCMLSCYCSKLMAEQTELSRHVTSQSNTFTGFLKGSFSDGFMASLDRCDKEYADEFCAIYSEKVRTIGESKESPLKFPGSTVEITEGDSIFDLTCEEFNQMWGKWRRSYEDAKGRNKKDLKEDRERSLVEMVSILRDRKANHKGQKEIDDEIYLAQIECWDRGISTYRFSYDEKKGLRSCETLGEMSRLIESWKYQPIVEEYYKRKLDALQGMDKEEETKLLGDAFQVYRSRFTESDKKSWRAF